MKNIKIFTLLYIPFLINDLFFINAYRYELWLFFDYFFKLIVLYIVFYFINKKKFTLLDLGIKKLPFKVFIFWSILLSITGIFIDQYLYEMINNNIVSWKLFSFPQIENILVGKFDLVFGLLLTAISEEVVFRGVAVMLLASYFKNSFLLVLFSSVVFGLAHWGLGIPLILSAAIWGILPAISVMKTGSIYPAIVAHYLTNFIDFSKLAH